MNNNIEKIHTIDINGNDCTFYIKDSTAFINRRILLNKNIYTKQDCSDTTFFEFLVVPFGESNGRVENMFANSSCFRKKGLPEALILYAKEKLKTTIYSSNQSKFDESFTNEAKKVWERLCMQKKALYDESLKRYKTI